MPGVRERRNRIERIWKRRQATTVIAGRREGENREERGPSVKGNWELLSERPSH